VPLSPTAASAAYIVEDQPSEAPPATIVVGGESVCVPIGDALMLGFHPLQHLSALLITPLWMFPCRLLTTGFHPH